MKLVCNPFLLNLLLLVWGIPSIFLCYIFEFWGLKPIFSMPIILYTYCIWNGAWMLSNVGHWGTVGFLDVFSLSVVKLHCSSWEVKKYGETIEAWWEKFHLLFYAFLLVLVWVMSLVLSYQSLVASRNVTDYKFIFNIAIVSQLF